MKLFKCLCVGLLMLISTSAMATEMSVDDTLNWIVKRGNSGVIHWADNQWRSTIKRVGKHGLMFTKETVGENCNYDYLASGSYDYRDIEWVEYKRSDYEGKYLHMIRVHFIEDVQRKKYESIVYNNCGEEAKTIQYIMDGYPVGRVKKRGDYGGSWKVGTLYLNSERAAKKIKKAYDHIRPKEFE